MKTTPSLLSSLRALPGPVWVLCLGTFLNRFGTFVIPFLTLYITGRGFTVTDAGFAIAAYGIGNVCATLVGGYLADHLGRRKTIAISMFSGAAVMMMLSQASGLGAIIVLAGLSGLTGELYRPASSALLGDLVPASNRVTAYSTYRMAINAGFAFGPATAGFLATRGYFWLFAGDAATSVLFGLVALVALPEGSHAGQKAAGWVEAAGALWRDKRLHVILVGAFGLAILFCQMTSTFSLAVLHLGFPASVYGLLLSLNGAMVVFIELPLTTVTRRFPSLAVISIGYALMSLGFGLIYFAQTIPLLVLCIAVLTMGEMIAMPVTSAYVAGLAPDNMRGRYMGAYGLTWTVAQIIIPGICMRLYEAEGRIFWLVCSLIGFVSAYSMVGWRRHLVAEAKPA